MADPHARARARVSDGDRAAVYRAVIGRVYAFHEQLTAADRNGAAERERDVTIERRVCDRDRRPTGPTRRLAYSAPHCESHQSVQRLLT